MIQPSEPPEALVRWLYQLWRETALERYQLRTTVQRLHDPLIIHTGPQDPESGS